MLLLILKLLLITKADWKCFDYFFFSPLNSQTQTLLIFIFNFCPLLPLPSLQHISYFGLPRREDEQEFMSQVFFIVFFSPFVYLNVCHMSSKSIHRGRRQATKVEKAIFTFYLTRQFCLSSADVVNTFYQSS